ncbi:prepilin-type N-terminal cleavage/methylation domain-containing protein [bacterium]|nr:prepilin-type N-terminal cleavage/methylation domain-containing protein [bacterium]
MIYYKYITKQKINKQAFTLVELIVVITILAIL